MKLKFNLWRKQYARALTTIHKIPGDEFRAGYQDVYFRKARRRNGIALLAVDNVEVVVGGGERGPNDAGVRVWERVRRRPGKAKHGHVTTFNIPLYLEHADEYL